MLTRVDHGDNGRGEVEPHEKLGHHGEEAKKGDRVAGAPKLCKEGKKATPVKDYVYNYSTGFPIPLR